MNVSKMLLIASVGIFLALSAQASSQSFDVKGDQAGEIIFALEDAGASPQCDSQLCRVSAQQITCMLTGNIVIAPHKCFLNTQGQDIYTLVGQNAHNLYDVMFAVINPPVTTDASPVTASSISCTFLKGTDDSQADCSLESQ